MSSFKKKEKRKNHYPGSGRNLEKLSPRRKLIRKGNWLAFELTVTTVNELVPTAEFRLSISQLIPANWRPDFRPRLTEICRNRGEIGTRFPTGSHPLLLLRVFLAPPLPNTQMEYSISLGFRVPLSDSTLAPTRGGRIPHAAHNRPPTCPSHSPFGAKGFAKKLPRSSVDSDRKTRALKREYYSKISSDSCSRFNASPGCATVVEK